MATAVISHISDTGTLPLQGRFPVSAAASAAVSANVPKPSESETASTPGASLKVSETVSIPGVKPVASITWSTK